MYDNFLLHFVQTKKSYPLKKGVVLIAGKSRDLSSLYLVPYFEGEEIQTISRRHFQLSYQPHGLFIKDLDSTNGTEVNGEALSPQKRRRLSHGNMIRLAKNDYFIIEVIDENHGTGVVDSPPAKPFTIPAHGVYFHEDENTFYVDGKAINGLEPRAMEVLEYLYKHKKRERSKVDILRDVFSFGTTEHSVRAAVSSIRAKFEEISAGSKTKYLKTVQGVGYKLVTE